MINQLLISLGRVPQQLANSGQFVVYAVRRFLGDGCPQSAAALTYMSLFAVVPMLTLMYSMFSLVPAFQELGGQVEEFIFSKFLPSSGQEITGYLSEFSSQARKLSVAGVAIIFLTALLMLSNIEKTFNHIWATTGGRKGLAGFLVYWAILSLGPLLLAIGMIMSTYLMSLRLVVAEVDSLGLVALLFSYLPWLLTWLAFTLLYVAVPNCKVRVVYALFGGLITTLLFESAKALFGQLVAHSIYTNVYGAVAVIPLFLMWIYLLWVLILFGAELVRSLETFQYQGRDTPLPDLLAVLIVLWQCWRRQQRGHSLSDRSMSIVGLNVEQWRRLRDMLLGQRILEKTASGQYLMIRDADTIRLADISGWLGQGFNSGDKAFNEKLVSAHPWIENYDRLMRDNQQLTEQNMNMSLQMLFASHSHSADTGNLKEI
jgi:membrane protein